MAEAQAVDTQKVDTLIKNILGQKRDGNEGQLHILKESVVRGNKLLANLTTRVQKTNAMINQLQAAQKELEQGRDQVKTDLDIKMARSAAELETLRTDLEQAEKNAREANDNAKKATENMQKAATEAAEAAAKQQVDVATAAKQQADAAEENARNVLQDAEKRHTEEYIKATEALDTINNLLNTRNIELKALLDNLETQVEMISSSQAPAQSPAPAPAPCGSNMKRDSTRCPNFDFPCLSDKNCYKPNVGAFMKTFSDKIPAVSAPTQGGKRRKSQRVKKSHKRKHHKTRKGKGGWQVSKPKSKKSRKSHRKQRRHGTRKHK